MGGTKRKRKQERPSIHPNNKYSENPPNFAHLASLYPSFQPFVKYSGESRPRIDWTDFNATRELTRVLLLHDHALNWWIPDGQLCPTVPNRSNYIHWVGDLLSSDIIPNTISTGGKVRGFDVGTGANCIYPLLGASLQGWSFVGSDVTDVAVEWAARNVNSNPHISELIEIRKVESNENTPCAEGLHSEESVDMGTNINVPGSADTEVAPLPSHGPLDSHACQIKNYHGPPILLGVVGDDERFDFCMCNPPFFESLEEAGLNPKTSCGGTSKEMVCPGGEKAFIARMIEDSVELKHHFRWFTSMVGRKSNLKHLISKLWEVGVTLVKTTEFVQGRTSRWGLAWSFLPPVQKASIALPEKNNMSFMLEGLQRQHGAINVLEAVKSYFSPHGVSCTLNSSSFTVDVVASKADCDSILKNELPVINKSIDCQPTRETSNRSSSNFPCDRLCLRISVFQQTPGTLLVKGSLRDRNNPLSGALSVVFQKLEEALRNKFCTKSL